MTALYPSREDSELNARALARARTGQEQRSGLPDGRRLDRTSGSERDRRRAVPASQSARERRPALRRRIPDLRPAPIGVGATTLDGRAPRCERSSAIATASEGKGASLLDGYMEDLATDRIYRLMIAQRMRYAGDYTPASISAMFDEELERILAELPTEPTIRRARGTSAHERFQKR